MSAYRASKKNKVIYILFIIVLTIIALIGVFCYQLSLHIDEMSQCESKMLATEIINQAAKEALKTTGTDDLIKEKLDENQVKRADVNLNGKPDAADSLAIMKFIVGVTTLPVKS